MFFWQIYFVFLILRIVNASDSVEIIIVGAGPAGIAAASKLYENGFNNVKILEAENRVGGRVYTAQVGDYLVDLGAQWVHGQVGNIAYELAEPLGLVANSTREPTLDVYDSSGTLLDQAISDSVTKFFINISDNMHNLNESNLDGSAGDYFDKKFVTYFENHPEINETLRKKLLHMHNTLESSGHAAENWYQPSLRGYVEFHVCEGDLVTNWKEKGYGTILDILMKKIPDAKNELPVLNNTILNTEVSNVNYGGEGDKIKIRTANGSEYLADHVIMTPSLGVLKKDHETLFNPPLSESKIKSIKGLAFGTACKLHMVFNESWWQIKEHHSGLTFLWDENDRKTLEQHPEKGWLTDIAFVITDEYKPHLLSIWTNARGCRMMENLSDQQVIEHTMEILNMFLGNWYNVTEPVAMIRSKWSTNKHFCGTYSFRSVETEKVNASAAILAEPIVQNGIPKILFAGEATEPHYYSTVHGAIVSGWREANRLIDLYSKKSD